MAISYADRFSYVGVDPFTFRFDVTQPQPAEPEFKFKKGDKVRVTLDGDATVTFAYDKSINLRLADGTDLTAVPAKHVTLKTPDSFPPKVGQVWKAGGKNYGVRPWVGSFGSVVVYPVDQKGLFYSDGSATNTLADFAKLRPTLVG